MSGADCLSDQVNYGSRLGEWQPSGGDHVPDGWGEDGVLDGNHDGDYLGMPDLTSFCTICRQIRREEPHLSHVEVRDVQVRVRFAYAWLQHTCGCVSPMSSCGCAMPCAGVVRTRTRPRTRCNGTVLQQNVR